MNAPKEYSIWYMLEPVVISMKTWRRLSEEDQKIFLEEAEKIHREWIPPHFQKASKELVDVYSKAGVKLHFMTREEFHEWLDLAKRTAWKNFAETVKGGQELLDLALQAME